MQRRQRNIIYSMVGLLLGGILYVLFRSNTYISRIFASSGMVLFLRELAEPYAWEFLRYYLPDFLWCFSLSCGIQAICLSERKEVILYALIAFLCGVTWELCQCMNIVSGVGDLYDVLMYFLGSSLSVLVNLKGEKK